MRRRPATTILAAALLALGARCTSATAPPAALDPVAWDEPEEPARPEEPIRPIPRAPRTDPRRASLGARLFAERALSRDGSIACVTCHPLDRGGADGNQRSTGVGGYVTRTNAPTIFNAAFNSRFNWDGAYGTLEEALDSPIRLAFQSDFPAVLRVVSASSDYRARFAAAYPDGVTEANLRDALATYIRTLVTPDAPLDRYLRGDADALDARARRGYSLFKDLGCASCHQGENAGGNMFAPLGVMLNDGGEPRPRLRVPSLRNVARTAPYFHNGSVPTLPEAVERMARMQLGRTLSAEQVALLVDFLNALTGRAPDVTAGAP